MFIGQYTKISNTTSIHLHDMWEQQKWQIPGVSTGRPAGRYCCKPRRPLLTKSCQCFTTLIYVCGRTDWIVWSPGGVKYRAPYGANKKSQIHILPLVLQRKCIKCKISHTASVFCWAHQNRRFCQFRDKKSYPTALPHCGTVVTPSANTSPSALSAQAG